LGKVAPEKISKIKEEINSLKKTEEEIKIEMEGFERKFLDEVGGL
jgi:hypothetical protein